MVFTNAHKCPGPLLNPITRLTASNGVGNRIPTFVRNDEASNLKPYIFHPVLYTNIRKTGTPSKKNRVFPGFLQLLLLKPSGLFLESLKNTARRFSHFLNNYLCCQPVKSFRPMIVTA